MPETCDCWVVATSGVLRLWRCLVPVLASSSPPPGSCPCDAQILMMARLRHFALATFYGACWEPPNVAVLMELFKMSAFDALAGPEVLSWADPLATWGVDIAVAMEYLHGQNVVHRDLKTQNIMLTEAMSAKVADLGESRPMATNVTMTSVGTPFWAAPEVLLSERYDEKCDVYSMGILVCEFQTREVPYAGIHPSRVLAAVCRGTLRPELPPETPPFIRALAAACWSHDPQARPSMAQVAAALTAFSRDPQGVTHFPSTFVSHVSFLAS